MYNKSELGTQGFQQIVIKLQDYIHNHDYVDGGWLPPGRKMAIKFGCSHLTYCKALNFVKLEGIAVSFPYRGHYIIPEYLRCKKVGMILGDGDTYTHHKRQRSTEGYHSTMSAVIDTLAEYRYDVQFLQTSRPKQTLDIADVYVVKGLIWLNPPAKYLPLIKQFRKKHPHLPLVLASEAYDPLLQEEGCFMPSIYTPLRKRLEFALERGHRRLLFMGDYEFVEKAKGISFLHANDCPFSEDDCYTENFFKYDEIVDLVKDRGYTMIVTNGGATKMHFLFEALHELSPEQQPEVLLYDQGVQEEIMNKGPIIFKGYPLEKILFVPDVPRNCVGAQAAIQLLTLMQKAAISAGPPLNYDT